MNTLRIETISDYDTAKELWNSFSPHITIDDDWEFRSTFFMPLPYKLQFYVAYDGDSPVALLPLQENNREALQPPYIPEAGNFLEFFGGDDTDDNQVFVHPGYESAVDQLVSHPKIQTILAPLAMETVGTKKGEFYTNKYLLPITGYANHEEYIEAVWSGSRKKKLRQQMRGLYNKYTIDVRYNHHEDLEIMFDLNVKRFGEHSSLSIPYRRQIFKDFLTKFQVEMVSVLVNGNVESVSYGIVHNGVYGGMNAGTNNDISDLGKLHVLLQIDRAIQLGCTTYDAGKGSGVWKEEFGFSKHPQYILKLT